jgi:hypothetical protein
MSLKKNRILIIFILMLIFIVNTFIVSQNDLSTYERLRDFLIVLLIFPFLTYSFYKIGKKNFIYYLILSNILFIIIVVHLLRLVFGGLLC